MDASVTLVNRPPVPARYAAAPSARGGQRSEMDTTAEEPQRDTAIITGSSQAGVPIATDQEFKQIEEILKLLENAKNKIREKVDQVITENEKEMKETEKAKLKKRAEQKIIEFNKKINNLKTKIEELLRLSPEGRGGVKDKIASLLEKTRKLASLANVSARDFDTVAKDVEELIFDIQEGLTELNNELKDDPRLAFIFGANWDTYMRLDALRDGTIQMNEWTGAGKEKARELGLLVDTPKGLGGIAADGLTNKEVRMLVHAKKAFALLLNAKIKEKGIPAKDVDGAWNQLAKLAAEGKLTREAANKILEKFGIKFTRAAYNVLLKASNLEEFLKKINNLFCTAQLVNDGLDVDLDALHERTDGEKDQIARRYYETLRSYAEEDDEGKFFVVDFKGARDKIIQALRNAYGEGKIPANLSYKELWKRLSALGGTLSEIIERINDRSDLNVDGKWDKLVLELLKRLHGRLYVSDKKKGAEENVARMENFRKLLTTVQNEPNSSKIVRAYVSEFSRVVLSGSKGVFDWEAVLAGKTSGNEAAVPSKGGS